MQDFLKANYHTHTYRCQHAAGTEREYIEAAIDMGIEKLGFSDHVPCPFDDDYVSYIRMTIDQVENYVDTIRALAREYASQIQIFVGFEAEYIPEFYDRQMQIFRAYQCDYMIMGQHFLEPENRGAYMGAVTDDESRIRAYVDSIIKGMNTGSYKYLAHPDLINYKGMDSVYDWEMTRLCKEMKRLDIPLELNVLGAKEGRQYPSEAFWKIAAENDNRVIIGLDAHNPEGVKDVESYNKVMDIVRKYNLNLTDDIGLPYLHHLGK